MNSPSTGADFPAWNAEGAGAEGTAHAGGRAELVELAADHPGFHDGVYRNRRNAIARQALEYCEGQAVPTISYSEDEQAVWRTVWSSLEPLHARYACSQYLAVADQVRLARERIPQLAEVNQTLATGCDFRMLPVAGLVAERTFLSYLARGIFLSTQYMRHHSMPLYTPEPDVVHELIGHAATFADADFARLSRAFGEAALRAKDAAAVHRVARLYWYTLEFGVVEQAGALKVYGAGLLSSSGELERFETQSELRPFTPEEACALRYDPSHYQQTLFVASSFAKMVEAVLSFLARI